MVFYTYDYTNFPTVKVIFNSEVVNSEVEEFFNEWLRIYDRNEEFVMLFDVTQVQSPTLWMAYKMVRFIGKLRQQHPQLFKKSYMIFPDYMYMRFLVNCTFTISKPVSKIWIYWKSKNSGTEIDLDNIVEYYENNPEKFYFIDN